jgi:DNA-binding NarL/FixJ family response regulator
MRKVLFVDDEIGFLENLQMLFSGDPDLEIAVVSEPEMALHKAINFKPEIIFLDVSMPTGQYKTFKLCQKRINFFTDLHRERSSKD